MLHTLSVTAPTSKRRRRPSGLELGGILAIPQKKQAELSLYWSDILSDKKNYYRNVTATGLTESRTSQIGSYFIISFKYRLNKQL